MNPLGNRSEIAMHSRTGGDGTGQETRRMGRDGTGHRRDGTGHRRDAGWEAGRDGTRHIVEGIY